MPPRRETTPTKKLNPRRIRDQTHQGAGGAAVGAAASAPQAGWVIELQKTAEAAKRIRAIAAKR